MTDPGKSADPDSLRRIVAPESLEELRYLVRTWERANSPENRAWTYNRLAEWLCSHTAEIVSALEERALSPQPQSPPPAGLTEMVKRARAYADSSPENSREAFRSFLNEMADVAESAAARLAEAEREFAEGFKIFETHMAGNLPIHQNPDNATAYFHARLWNWIGGLHDARASRAGTGETR